LLTVTVTAAVARPFGKIVIPLVGENVTAVVEKL
jgi:hypothetical protein